MSKKAIRILIVDDSPEDRETYQCRLREDRDHVYSSRETALGEQGLRLCRVELPDCVILDYNLPDLDGLEFLQRLRAEHGEMATAVIVLTGTGNEAIAVEAMKQGAQDYLVKGMGEAAELPRVVHAAIERIAMHRQLQDQQRELAAAAVRLRESEERHRLLIDGIQDYGIFMLDAGGHVVSWNPGAERIEGYRPEEILGRHYSCFYPEEERVAGKPAAILQIAVEHGKHADEGWMLRKDGSRFWASTLLSALPGENVPVRGFAQIVHDATERKRLEDSLDRRAEQLVDAARRKDEFLAMLAHELRNPLAPIRSGLDLLAGERRSDDTLILMREQVTHMVRLVDDLLDASRIKLGKIELKKAPLELGGLLTRAVEAARPAMDSRGHELVLRGPAEPIWVDGDSIRLTQVFTNLLANAAKFTEPNGRVEIEARIEPQGIRVTIKDNGIGIEPDLLPCIFDLFTQGNRSIDRGQGGLGIGLTLVQSLIELHDGSVSVASDGVGRGSEFSICLPTLSEPHAQPVESWHPLPSRKLRVLVVDDNIGAAKILSRMLVKFWGHEVHMAYDGTTAIEEAKKFRPELMLLDIGLPGLDGYEVARRLRAERIFARTILVALTGYGQEEDRVRSHAAGFDEHLTKPASVEMLETLFSRRDFQISE